jgi:hypothetical protein
MIELLIIKPSSLGDIVHALQVATAVKAQRDDVRISWVVREIFRADRAGLRGGGSGLRVRAKCGC